MARLKVIIDRAKWIRGEDENSRLRMEDGRMCAMGFACVAVGVPERYLVDTVDLLSIESVLPEPLATIAKDSYAMSMIFNVNDNHEYEEDRERLLIEQGGMVGLDFEFKGGKRE